MWLIVEKADFFTGAFYAHEQHLGFGITMEGGGLLVFLKISVSKFILLVLRKSY
jgi:hypothetical protein